MNTKINKYQKYLIWHKSLVINTDPTLGGDAYCGEFAPEILWNFELVATIAWGILCVGFILYQYIAKKKTNYQSV